MIEPPVAAPARCRDRRPLSFGLIGCGEIAVTQHLPAVRRSEQCEVTIVCDVDRSSADRAARSVSSARSADSIDEVLEANLDGVIIATPPTATPDLVARALRRGIPVLCEKPIATTREEGFGLAVVQRECGVPCQVGYKNRFAPLVRRLKQWLDGLEPVGELLARFHSFDEVWYPGADNHGFARRTGATLAAGDPIIHEGTHHLDLLMWLLGDVASVEHARRLRISSGEALEPHYTQATLRFERGHLATVATGWCYPQAIMGEYQIWSASGFAEVSRDRCTLTLSDGRETFVTTDATNWQTEAFDAQLAAFVNLILGGPQLGATVDDACRALDVGLRIVEASERVLDRRAPAVDEE